jgi:hypothetical protein
MSELAIEASEQSRTHNKQGQLFWTVRKLKGDKPGPGGNWFYIFRYEAKRKRVVKWFAAEKDAKAKAKELNLELTQNELTASWTA